MSGNNGQNNPSETPLEYMQSFLETLAQGHLHDPEQKKAVILFTYEQMKARLPLPEGMTDRQFVLSLHSAFHNNLKQFHKEPQLMKKIRKAAKERAAYAAQFKDSEA